MKPRKPTNRQQRIGSLTARHSLLLQPSRMLRRTERGPVPRFRG